MVNNYIELKLGEIKIMSNNQGMGSGDIPWMGQKTPTKYQHLPLSEAIRLTEIDEENARKAHIALEERRFEQRVAKELEERLAGAEVVEPVPEGISNVEVPADKPIMVDAEISDVAFRAFTNEQLAKVTNKVFALGAVDIKHIGIDCVELELDGVPIKILPN